MSYNGSGVYSLPAGNPVVTGTTISSTTQNNTLSDIATALSNVICKDGQSTPTANIKLGGFKLTGLAAGSTNGDSVRYEQLFGAFLPISGGTLTGSLLFTDATYDIGAAGATRPRDFYLSRNAIVSGTLAVTGAATLSSTINKVTITAPASSATLTLADGSSLITVGGNSLTFTTTGTTNVTLPTSGTLSTGPTLGTPQASTSGTTIDFTLSFSPKRIVIGFVGVSTNGTNNYLVQIGPSGGVESSGYTSVGSTDSGSTRLTSSSGFLLTAVINSAAIAVHGSCTLVCENTSTNTWTCTSLLVETATPLGNYGAGSKSCAGAVTKVRITTVGGATFDAGEINVTFD
jgi:hypothetical protein